MSLAEFDKAMRDILQVPQLFAAKPVLLRAFNAAKAKSKSDSSYGDDYIEKSEYRHLLKYLRIYYEYFVAFQRIDVNGDRRISYKEFERAAPYLQRWGIDTSNLQREWSECDQDGGGQVLFDEFAYWAIKKNLDIEDDDDDDDNTDSDPDYAVDRDISERELKLYAQKQKQKPPLKLKNHDSKIWEELRRKLPWKKTATDKRLRDEQWRILDNNKNGLLSLAEFDKGLRDVLELPVLFKTKPVIIRAFTSAKSKVKSNADAGDDYI